MSVAAKEKVPTQLLELIDKQDSGYVRDDTKGTAFEEKIQCASVLFVPNSGYMSEEIIVDGKKTGRFANVKIRYIKGCPYIKPEEQLKFGWEKNSIPLEDTIIIKKGQSIVKDEGDRALYEYMSKVYYNESAPNRPLRAKALFKVNEVNKKVETVNENKFIQAKAIGYVETLCFKKANGEYEYKETQIDNILTLLNEFGGNDYSEKINVLTRYAEKQPNHFLTTVTKMDDLLTLEVTHALELDVIKFNGNTVEYVKDKKVLANLGTETLSNPKKIEALSNLLRTPEYEQAYKELKVKIEIAQETQLKA